MKTRTLSSESVLFALHMEKEKQFIKNIIEDYERDILGYRYSFVLSDGETISFRIDPENVPHLLGVRKLPLRQVQGKSAGAVYKMLKDGKLTLDAFRSHKEEYKKAMNFHHLVSILHCGDAVKVVKRVGRLTSGYFLYLDHRPHSIIHLGIAKDSANRWYPESLLVINRRNVDSYIKDQVPVDILDSCIIEDDVQKARGLTPGL